MVKDISKFLDVNFPNTKVFIISDHHFYHENIIKYERTEFSSIEEMNEYLIKVHNETVTDDDLVIFLGDFSFKLNKVSELNKRLNGKKLLIMGNHDDEKLLKRDKEYGFEFIYTTSISVGYDIFSHYPLMESIIESNHEKMIAYAFKKAGHGNNYHGHIHSHILSGNKFINVSAEAINYKPVYLFTTGSYESDYCAFNIENVINHIHKLNIKNVALINNLINDYIYSFILSYLKHHLNNFYVHGSYAYNKVHNLGMVTSDLDNE